MARRHNAGMRQHLSETTSTQRFLYGLLAGVAAACWPTALRPETRALLEKGLQGLVKNGTYKQLIEKWNFPDSVALF